MIFTPSSINLSSRYSLYDGFTFTCNEGYLDTNCTRISGGMSEDDTLGQDRLSSRAIYAGMYSSSEFHSALSIALIEYIARESKFIERIPALRNPI